MIISDWLMHCFMMFQKFAFSVFIFLIMKAIWMQFRRQKTYLGKNEKTRNHPKSYYSKITIWYMSFIHPLIHSGKIYFACIMCPVLPLLPVPDLWTPSNTCWWPSFSSLCSDHSWVILNPQGGRNMKFSCYQHPPLTSRILHEREINTLFVNPCILRALCYSNLVNLSYNKCTNDDWTQGICWPSCSSNRLPSFCKRQLQHSHIWKPSLFSLGHIPFSVQSIIKFCCQNFWNGS